MSQAWMNRCTAVAALRCQLFSDFWEQRSELCSSIEYPRRASRVLPFKFTFLHDFQATESKMSIVLRLADLILPTHPRILSNWPYCLKFDFESTEFLSLAKFDITYPFAIGTFSMTTRRRRALIIGFGATCFSSTIIQKIVDDCWDSNSFCFLWNC